MQGLELKFYEDEIHNVKKENKYEYLSVNFSKIFHLWKVRDHFNWRKKCQESNIFSIFRFSVPLRGIQTSYGNCGHRHKKKNGEHRGEVTPTPPKFRVHFSLKVLLRDHVHWKTECRVTEMDLPPSSSGKRSTWEEKYLAKNTNLTERGGGGWLVTRNFFINWSLTSYPICQLITS